jgi:TRAP-type C4-dicarboxylate transport system permease small subunit
VNGPGGEESPGAEGASVERALYYTERIFIWVGILLLAAMIVAVWLQVFSRYVLHLSLPWTEEAGRYLFVWESFIGAAVLVGRDEHFSIDLVVRQMPCGARRALRVGVTCVVIVFALLMVTYGLSVSRRLISASSPVLQVSLGAVYGIIPISGLYMLLHGVLKLMRLLGRHSCEERQPC